MHADLEWNKYNQTHCDFDNLPSKILQGYKFNIFYFDLMHKSSAPENFLEVCTDNVDSAILRFPSGPPYEHCLQDYQPQVGVLPLPRFQLPVH